MNVLQKAAREPNLDKSLNLVQTALGIDSGDVAALFCSENDISEDNWQKMQAHERAEHLADYLGLEAIVEGS